MQDGVYRYTAYQCGKIRVRPVLYEFFAMEAYWNEHRRKGGHRKEIAEWQRRLPDRVYAYHWRRWSNRTFFLLDGDENVVCQLVAFAKRWHPHCELIHPEA